MVGPELLVNGAEKFLSAVVPMFGTLVRPTPLDVEMCEACEAAAKVQPVKSRDGRAREFEVERRKAAEAAKLKLK